MQQGFSSVHRRRFFPHPRRPPNPASAFVGHHARADRVAWGAGRAVNAAFGRGDLAQHHAGAIAAWGHFARMFPRLIVIAGKLQAGIVGIVFGL